MDKTINKHPSYAMAGFKRVHSGGNHKFFGSDIDCSSWIELEIKKGCEYFRDGEKYPSSVFDGGGSYISVAFTPVQFAELLTTLNMGEGVPCTITTLDNKMVERIPDDFSPNSLDYQKGHFKKELKDFNNNLKSSIDSVSELLKKKTLSKADKETILNIFSNISRKVNSDIPYYVEYYKEATDKIVTHAKGEIDAALQHCLINTGLKALGVDFKKDENLKQIEVKDNE